MQLYHYRPIESALLEIGNGTFHFARREELNDPIEGYVRVFWQGDKAAWEGLFRNYICSVNQAIDLFLLRANEDMLHHKTLIVDLHRFDHLPFGKILKNLGDAFLADEEIQKLTDFYGSSEKKVHTEELKLILYIIHSKALILCIQKCLDNKTMPAETASGLLKMFRNQKMIPFPFVSTEEGLSNEKQRAFIAKFAEDIIEDLRDRQYVQFGFNDETFLYGKLINEDAPTEARQYRNWMTIGADFPKVYVTQLKEMIYPESYVVCFSGKNDDSAMWGNYADHHQGVCLIYDADALDRMRFKGGEGVKAVSYEGRPIERNFFETFGRLTRSQIATWLTGTKGLSRCYEFFSDEQTWRDSYWEAYVAKTYRKLKAWEHENEYRIALSNSFYNFDEPTSRNLPYDSKALKGVVFGINTSEYDKKRIMEKLLDHADELTDFTFYQAEYDDASQKIKIRKKMGWNLKR